MQADLSSSCSAINNLVLGTGCSVTCSAGCSSNLYSSNLYVCCEAGLSAFPAGSACASNSACQSGNCVGGFCCATSSPCTSSCAVTSGYCRDYPGTFCGGQASTCSITGGDPTTCFISGNLINRNSYCMGVSYSSSSSGVTCNLAPYTEYTAACESGLSANSNGGTCASKSDCASGYCSPSGVCTSGAAWRVGATGLSCTSVCSNYGGCIQSSLAGVTSQAAMSAALTSAGVSSCSTTGQTGYLTGSFTPVVSLSTGTARYSLCTYDVGQGTCSAVPTGSFQRLCPCASAALQCPAGSYLASSACQLCAPGSFSASPGSTSCQQCAANTYANAYGSTSCASCASGTYSPAGSISSAACVCPGGQWRSGGLCYNCPAGTSSSMGDASCTICGAGQTSSGGDYCYTSSEGMYSNPGLFLVDSSNYNLYWANADPPTMHYVTNALQYYANANSNACFFCGGALNVCSSSFTTSRATILSYPLSPSSFDCTVFSKVCPTGTYCVRGAYNPAQCPAGTYGASQGLATASCSGRCPPGFWCGAGTTNPNPCPSNSMSLIGSSSASDCKAYVPNPGLQCPPNTFSTTLGCISCAAGLVAPAGSLSFSACVSPPLAGFAFCGGAPPGGSSAYCSITAGSYKSKKSGSCIVNKNFVTGGGYGYGWSCIASSCDTLGGGKDQGCAYDAATSVCCPAGTGALASGAPCDKGASCASGYCVGGICCSSQCSGTCASGTCCPSSCPSGVCDSAGNCLGAAGATCQISSQCLSGACAGNTCCTSACPTACDGRGYCLGAAASACAADKQCLSGKCASGFCCDSSGGCPTAQWNVSTISPRTVSLDDNPTNPTALYLQCRKDLSSDANGNMYIMGPWDNLVRVSPTGEARTVTYLRFMRTYAPDHPSIYGLVLDNSGCNSGLDFDLERTFGLEKSIAVSPSGTVYFASNRISAIFSVPSSGAVFKYAGNNQLCVKGVVSNRHYRK